MGLPPCGTDMAHHALTSTSPAYLAHKAAFDAAWHQGAVLAVYDSMEVYTLPLVVHVIHRGSPIGVEENISDAQICPPSTP